MKKDTSLKAFIESAEKRKTVKQKVVAWIKERGNGDIMEMRSLLNIRHQTLTSAISELEDMGILIPVGKRAGRWTRYRLAMSEKEREGYRLKRKLEKEIYTLQRAVEILMNEPYKIEICALMNLRRILDDLKEIYDGLKEELITLKS